MNKQRKRRLESVLFQLTDIIENEQSAYDNMPESIQGSERGEAMETGLDSLNEAKDLIEEQV